MALKNIILNPDSLWSKLKKHRETGVRKDGSLAGIQPEYLSHATLQD